MNAHIGQNVIDRPSTADSAERMGERAEEGPGGRTAKRTLSPGRKADPQHAREWDRAREREGPGERERERAEAMRHRTAAIFGTAAAASGPSFTTAANTAPTADATAAPTATAAGPAPQPRPDARLADPLPGLPVFGDGAVGRLRTWLFVRCGFEFRTVVALAVVLVAAGGLAFQHYWSGRPHAVRVPPPTAAGPPRLPPEVGPAKPAAAVQLTVDIAGKVEKPGLRRLPKGARVADALAAAGGTLPGTDTTALNLARPLTDGEQILVGVHPPPPADPSAATSASPAAPLSLTSATSAQLDSLPGVGPVLAQHILAFRTQHGGFTSLQQLRQIPGIGPRKFATLQPLVQP